MKVFDSTMKLLEKSIDFSSVKNNVISNNIANIDTPNYRAKNVLFKDVLHNNMQSLQAKRTNEKHRPFSEQLNHYRIVTDNNYVYNHNGNNVDIDKEMAELAKNQIYYQSVVDRLNGKFNVLQTVVRG